MIRNNVDRDLYGRVGARIQQRRRHLDLTQAQLAEAVGICSSLVTHYEKGTRLIPLDTLVRVAKRLRVSLGDLVG